MDNIAKVGLMTGPAAERHPTVQDLIRLANKECGPWPSPFSLI